MGGAAPPPEAEERRAPVAASAAPEPRERAAEPRADRVERDRQPAAAPPGSLPTAVGKAGSDAVAQERGDVAKERDATKERDAAKAAVQPAAAAEAKPPTTKAMDKAEEPPKSSSSRVTAPESVGPPEKPVAPGPQAQASMGLADVSTSSKESGREAPAAAKDIVQSKESAPPVKEAAQSKEALPAKSPAVPAPLPAAPSRDLEEDKSSKAAITPAAEKEEGVRAAVDPAAAAEEKVLVPDLAGGAAAAAVAAGEAQSAEPSFRPSVPQRDGRADAAAREAAAQPLPGERRVYEIEFLIKFRAAFVKEPACLKLSQAADLCALMGRGGPEGALPSPMASSSGGGGTPRGGGGPSGMHQGSSSQMRQPPPQRGNQPPMRGMQQQNSGRSMGGFPGKAGGGPPIELKKSDNAYDTAKTKPQTHYDRIMKEARGILNKLTLTNFDKLAQDVTKLDISHQDELKGLVGIIFDKSLEEAHFCNMYARLCNDIKDKLPKFDDTTIDQDPVPGQPPPPKKEINFKRSLLNKCQEEFERADRYDELTDAETAGMSPEEKRNKTRKVRVRMLFSLNMLNEKIMHDCIRLLFKMGTKDLKDHVCVEDAIECLCKFMVTVGSRLDHKDAQNYMNHYFDLMKETVRLL